MTSDVTELILSEGDRRQLIEIFLGEADEVLSRFEDLLLQLEHSPGDPELLHEIFRAAHTLKGNAASLRFHDLASFAHVVEETLEKLRNGAMQATPARISQLLQAVDVLRDLSIRSIAGDATLTGAQQELLAAFSQDSAHAAPESDPKQAPPARTPAPDSRQAHSLRVEMEKLDRMLDLTGEISIARGRVRELVLAGEERERILDAVHDLDRLSLDLQEQVMGARLVPVGPALRHFQRVVRDLAAARQKRVALVIEGNEVELDATVLERLKDPITQMIRNAVDHGIETPQERRASGKPEAGTIRITAAHESGVVVLCVSDDGRGLNEWKIAARARSLGIDCDRLSRKEILGLIFQPGFSTAAAVTEISGRGVGMDVVLSNVQSLRGSLTVASEDGVGTTITMRLPLTIALIEGFGVRVADETYIIPMDAVVECVDVPAECGREMRGVLNLRGKAVPFVRLRDLFGLQGDCAGREHAVIVQDELGQAGIVVDELLGSSQAVMKPLSRMIRRVVALAGSSILGNGRVALILDAEKLVRHAIEYEPAA